MICRDDSTVNTFRPRARPLFQYRHYRYCFLHFLNVTHLFFGCVYLNSFNVNKVLRNSL